MRNYKQPKRKYLIDFTIITGLNLTIDQKKIRRNCKLHKIDMSDSPTKISKRNNVAIATIGLGNNNFLQYEVKHNLDVTKLNKIDNNIIPDDIKSIILEAYCLTRIQALEDLISKN